MRGERTSELKDTKRTDSLGPLSFDETLTWNTYYNEELRLHGQRNHEIVEFLTRLYWTFECYPLVPWNKVQRRRLRATESTLECNSPRVFILKQRQLVIVHPSRITRYPCMNSAFATISIEVEVPLRTYGVLISARRERDRLPRDSLIFTRSDSFRYAAGGCRERKIVLSKSSLA